MRFVHVSLALVLAGCPVSSGKERHSPPASASASSAGASPPLQHASPEPFERCVTELLVRDEPMVRRSIQRRYRLSEDDAHDLVRDALISVCSRHAAEAYTGSGVGAALTIAAENRARDDWRRRRRYGRCPLDEQIPSCLVSGDNLARFNQEQLVAEAALCKEDSASQRIIRERVIEGTDFRTIGAALGLTEAEARTRFHNALRRVQKRVRDACRF